MKSIMKDYAANLIGIIVFCIMLYSAFEQNYTIAQAYSVSLIFGVLSNIVAADFIKRL